MMNDDPQCRSRLLILAAFPPPAQPDDSPAFAILKLDAATRDRLLLMEQLATAHKLVSITIDNVRVDWDRTGEPVESTWLNLFRGQLTLDGYRGLAATSVSTDQFTLATLRSIFKSDQPHLVFSARRPKREAESFELNAIIKLERQGHIDGSTAQDCRRFIAARRPP